MEITMIEINFRFGATWNLEFSSLQQRGIIQLSQEVEKLRRTTLKKTRLS